jgi:hypothetical protein
LGLVLYSGTATAQTGTWTPPFSGYVHDAINRSIRPVTGFIGAAVLGPSVADGIDWVSMAPNQKSALAERNGSRIWMPDLSLAGTWQNLDRTPLARQAIWATDSSRAVILAEGAQVFWLDIINSVPVPESSWTLERYSRIGSPRPQPLRIGLGRDETVWSLLAADSSADKVLLASRTGENWQIWLASTTLPPLRIPFSGHPVAAAFAAGAGGVFVADAASHSIVRIQNLEMAPVLTSVFSSEVYVNDPAALVLSSDGNRLFVADRTDKMIRVIDLSGNLKAELPSDVAPVSLTNVSPDRFLVNAGQDAGHDAGQPLYVLDTGVIAKVSFVPRGE